MYIRALERVLVVGIGALSICLGYLLFRAVKATGESEAHIKLPGDATVMLTRVGPGVFFALFGTLVIGASFVYPVSYTETVRTTGQGIEKQTRVTGIVASPVGSSDAAGTQGGGTQSSAQSDSVHAAREMDRLRARRWIELLNQMQGASEPRFSEAQRARVRRDVAGAKLYLMKTVWAEDWGPYEDFVAWTEGGADPIAAKRFGSAPEFFAAGRERSP